MNRVRFSLVTVLVFCLPAFAGLTSSGDVTPFNPSTWDPYSEVWIGETGEGSVVIDAGSTAANGACYMGYSWGAVGTMTVQDAGSLWESYEVIHAGVEGEGRLNILAGASVQTYECYMGDSPDSLGSVYVSGGDSTLDACYISVGSEGQGELHVRQGGQVYGYLEVGYWTGSMGLVTVRGKDSTITSDYIVVGIEGQGRLEIDNQGKVTGSMVYIDGEPGTPGVVEIDGYRSSLTMDSTLYVGVYGEGLLSITDGGCLDGHSGYIGDESGAVGVVTVDGAGTRWSASANLYIGYNGTGTVEITNGGLLRVGNTLTIDYGSTGTSGIHMATGGQLAVAGAATTLTEFLNLINGSDAIYYWNSGLSDWADISGATAGTDYTVSNGTGGLSGYAVLTVTAEPPAGDIQLEWSSYYSLQAQYDNGDTISYTESVTPPAGVSDWTIHASADSSSLAAGSEGWLSGEVKRTLDGGYTVTLDSYAILQADLQDAGSSAANAVTDQYFMMVITIAGGQHYAYDLSSDGDSSRGVTFLAAGDGDLTFGHTTCELNDSLTEEGYRVLRGRSEPYLLYGGLCGTLSDTTHDGLAGTAEVMQNIVLTLTPVTDMSYDLSDFASFASTWNLILGRVDYNDNWDLIDDNVIDVLDLVAFCNSWLQ